MKVFILKLYYLQKKKTILKLCTISKSYITNIYTTKGDFSKQKLLVGVLPRFNHILRHRLENSRKFLQFITGNIFDKISTNIAKFRTIFNFASSICFGIFKLESRFPRQIEPMSKNVL